MIKTYYHPILIGISLTFKKHTPTPLIPQNSPQFLFSLYTLMKNKANFMNFCGYGGEFYG